MVVAVTATADSNTPALTTTTVTTPAAEHQQVVDSPHR